MYRSSLILLLAIFAVLLAAPLDLNKDMSDEVFILMLGFSMGECKSELKVKTDFASLINDTETTMPDIMKCYVKCILEGMGLFKNGRVVEKKALQWIEEDRKENATLGKQEMAVFNTCKDLKSKDECETAAKIFICARDQYNKLGIDLL